MKKSEELRRKQAVMHVLNMQVKETCYQPQREMVVRKKKQVEKEISLLKAKEMGTEDKLS